MAVWYVLCIEKRKNSPVWCRVFGWYALCILGLFTWFGLMFIYFSKELQRLVQDTNELFPHSAFCIKCPRASTSGSADRSQEWQVLGNQEQADPRCHLLFRGVLSVSPAVPSVHFMESCNFLSFRIGGSKVTAFLEHFLFYYWWNTWC